MPVAHSPSIVRYDAKVVRRDSIWGSNAAVAKCRKCTAPPAFAAHKACSFGKKCVFWNLSKDDQVLRFYDDLLFEVAVQIAVRFSCLKRQPNFDLRSIWERLLRE